MYINTLQSNGTNKVQNKSNLSIRNSILSRKKQTY